jgi:hypothetical protein
MTASAIPSPRGDTPATTRPITNSNATTPISAARTIANITESKRTPAQGEPNRLSDLHAPGFRPFCCSRLWPWGLGVTGLTSKSTEESSTRLPNFRSAKMVAAYSPAEPAIYFVLNTPQVFFRHSGAWSTGFYDEITCHLVLRPAILACNY